MSCEIVIFDILFTVFTNLSLLTGLFHCANIKQINYIIAYIEFNFVAISLKKIKNFSRIRKLDDCCFITILTYIQYLKMQGLEVPSSQFYKRFQILDDIDQGAFGTVFKAYDRQKNQNVAIKKLRFIDKNMIATIKKEFQIMKAVSHSNITQALGLFYVIEKENYYLVTIFYQNGSLTKNIKNFKNRGISFVLKSIQEIVSGVKALHDQNIMHRDISPNNILFDTNWTVKICDFGLSKAYKDSQPIAQTTNVGTQVFRDPNIDSGVYSPKCDVFSIGLVIDYIFRSTTIFKTDEKISDQHKKFQKNKQEIIDQLQCPEQIKKVILKCLQNNDKDRIDISELYEQITRIRMKISNNLSNLKKNGAKNSYLISDKQINQSLYTNETTLVKQLQYQDTQICKVVICLKNKKDQIEILNSIKQKLQYYSQSLLKIKQIQQICYILKLHAYQCYLIYIGFFLCFIKSIKSKIEQLQNMKNLTKSTINIDLAKRLINNFERLIKLADNKVKMFCKKLKISARVLTVQAESINQITRIYDFDKQAQIQWSAFDCQRIFQNIISSMNACKANDRLQLIFKFYQN